MGSQVIITPDPPSQVTITPDAPEGAVSRFLSHATGLPVSDIAAHPGKYLNPFNKDYQQAAKDNANQRFTPTLRDAIPFGQTAKDLHEGNIAGALGDVTPGVIAAAQIGAPLAGRAMASPLGRTMIEKGMPFATGAAGAKLGSLVGEPIVGTAAGAYLGKQIAPQVANSLARLGAQLQRFGLSLTPAEAQAHVKALTGGAIEMPGEVQTQNAPAYSPTTRAQRLGLMLKDGRSIELPGNLQESIPPPFATDTRAQRLNLLLPEKTPSSSAVQLPESSLPAETQQPGYPGALQSRPQGRAEVVDDKIVQDRMRTDLDKHGWNALSEEKQMYYANNAPQFTKRQLIAQEQARALVEQAQGQAQKILEQARIAAETPAKYTKTVTPKAPVSAAAKPQPITQGLDVNQDLTDILQRSLDAVNARKAGK